MSSPILAAPAAAQVDDAQAAKAKYASGERHFDLSEYEDALADFKDAYRFKPDPAFLYNIAQCHRKLGQAEEAIAFYQSYLRRAPDARNRDEVERRIRELEALRDTQSNAAAAAASDSPRSGPLPVQPATKVEDVAIPPALPLALDLATPSSEAPPPAHAPEYTRWWFWTAVGAVAVGTATVLIVMASRDHTKIPSADLGSQKALP